MTDPETPSSPDASPASWEAVLKRDRAIVIAALIAVTAASWIYLIRMAAAMSGMESDMAMPMGDGMDMMAMPEWTPSYFGMMFTMWTIMMVGMMVPSAAPMVLVFAGYQRKRREQARPYVPTAFFLGGYLVVWTAFSLAATVLQWGLDRAALLSPMMVSASPWLGAGILVAAGVFQLTPLKDACLSHCRSPLHFFMHGFRPGALGALRMGIEHGGYCLGCCWILMALLFVGGVMNILWIALITIFVLLEKVAPFGMRLGRVCGGLMIAAGLLFIARAF